MANRRDTFAKRQRESDLKERARAKEARRVAKRSEVRTVKGPETVSLADVHALVHGSDPLAPISPAPPETAGDTDPADPAE